MYGITFDLDAHILEDELGIDRQDAYRAVEKALAAIGYVRARHSVYVCPEPSSGKFLAVHDTIVALRALPWFAEAATGVVAFELDCWGDLSGAFEEA